MDKVRPIMHAFGHIHEARGYIYENEILFVNGAILDDNYKENYSIFYVKIDKKNFST